MVRFRLYNTDCIYLQDICKNVSNIHSEIIGYSSYRELVYHQLLRNL